ncbi:molybdate ABC transporter substrate-binding protein [Nisaea acidiphila]|uniref:Molybdate ABC transporter substrate-binding protein n=1 Tax=Nisaea acidiphila TaxID=1862145 RepID=A0A9J7AUT5_9PROT|nr:molybdate ABC transporter substrate-binding protein [Nisaea acidiphila]UUX51087.1 molybdate ABC transporter substrate-binding protein [Nisaea acidiphila]
MTAPFRLYTLALLLAFFLVGPARGTNAAEANIAVAANFTSAAEDLAAAFEQKTGHRVILSTGSTGQLYAQITQGAPFDALLAADTARPERLHAVGMAGAAPFTYATGRLALWSPDPALIPGDGQTFLAAGVAGRLAIANPKLAPYGLAAKETLTAMGLWERYNASLAMGQNIAQTFQMTASGAAPAGFVALSQILAAPAELRGSHWPVPAAMHAPIHQSAVLLKRGSGNDAAEAFLAYLTAPDGCGTIRAAGYTPSGSCR